MLKECSICREKTIESRAVNSFDINLKSRIVHVASLSPLSRRPSSKLTPSLSTLLVVFFDVHVSLASQLFYQAIFADPDFVFTPPSLVFSLHLGSPLLNLHEFPYYWWNVREAQASFQYFGWLLTSSRLGAAYIGVIVAGLYDFLLFYASFRFSKSIMLSLHGGLNLSSSLSRLEININTSFLCPNMVLFYATKGYLAPKNDCTQYPKTNLRHLIRVLVVGRCCHGLWYDPSNFDIPYW